MNKEINFDLLGSTYYLYVNRWAYHVQLQTIPYQRPAEERYFRYYEKELGFIKWNVKAVLSRVSFRETCIQTSLRREM